MTNRLYLEDPYLREFTSGVIEHMEVKGKPAILLEQTVFYPTSGGQPHDTGTLNDISVVDVFEDESKRIVHLLEEPLGESRVDGRIDWQRRFDHMQQHTGQHILSQAFLKTCDADTLSFHLGEKSATIDLNQSGFPIEKIRSVENLANRIIYENRMVTGHIVGKHEMDRFPVRKPPAVEEDIRIIEIQDFDYSPCGGTHCAQTGEIGMIKITRYENYKGGTRVHFVCGSRALEDYQKKLEIVQQLCTTLSAGEADLHHNIQKTREDLKQLRREHANIKKQLLDFEAQALVSGRQKISGAYLVEKIFENRNPRELKILADKVLENSPGTVILFGARTEGKASLFFQCSDQLPFNMGNLMKTACTVISGRGGGHPHQAQGGGPDATNLEKALQCAIDKLAGAEGT